jgi:hypothetical protein
MSEQFSDAVSRALTGRAGALARRLADVVERTCTPDSGAPAAAAFLREWADTVEAEPDPLAVEQPIDRLVGAFGLDPAESDLILLAGLAEEHEGLAGTIRQLSVRGDPAPTIGLAGLVVEDQVPDRAALRRLLHEGRGVRSGILRVAGDGPFFERSLLLADGLWSALHGHEGRPESLRLEVPTQVPVGLAGWLESPAAQRAVTALASPASRLVLVTADDESVGMSRCLALAQAGQVTLTVARVAADDEDAIRLLALHAVAHGSVPVLLVRRPEPGARAGALAPVGLAGPVLAVAPAGAVLAAAELPVLTVPLGPLGQEDRRTAWRAAVPEGDALAGLLASRHPLDPAITAQVAVDLRSQRDLSPDEPVDEVVVAATIRARAVSILPPGVDLVTPGAGWDRLVLTGEPHDLLLAAVRRLAHASLVLDEWGVAEAARADRGARLLFTGPPGTGKSLAAEVVASAAGTDLLTVDVSQVVSKWIGETEKNLAAVFDVAERTQAVLLLDEADALFGSRTEIADAHDRYANLETAFLLQRLDRFAGLAVLATNLRHNIDAAFVRRMDFVVDFDVPAADERLELWKMHLPDERLGDDVDLRALADRFAVAGGWIRNAAIAAAFLAAEQGSVIRQEHLVTAVRREYAKSGRPFPGSPPSRAQADQRALAALAAVSQTSQPMPPPPEERT